MPMSLLPEVTTGTFLHPCNLPAPYTLFTIDTVIASRVQGNELTDKKIVAIYPQLLL